MPRNDRRGRRERRGLQEILRVILKELEARNPRGLRQQSQVGRILEILHLKVW